MSTAVLNRDLVKQTLENASENSADEVMLNRFTDFTLKHINLGQLPSSCQC